MRLLHRVVGADGGIGTSNPSKGPLSAAFKKAFMGAHELGSAGAVRITSVAREAAEDAAPCAEAIVAAADVASREGKRGDHSVVLKLIRSDAGSNWLLMSASCSPCRGSPSSTPCAHIVAVALKVTAGQERVVSNLCDCTARRTDLTRELIRIPSEERGRVAVDWP